MRVYGELIFFVIGLIWSASANPFLRFATADNIICPNKQIECLASYTCCFDSQEGGYGCCPKSNAVCCSDGRHCCEHGYTCNDASGTCNPGAVEGRMELVAITENINEKPSRLSLESESCPDGNSACPDGNTCCKTARNDWGCCPKPNAVCCSDRKHCCPEGFQCSVNACKKSDNFVPWEQLTVKSDEKILQEKPSVSSNYCPDGSSCKDTYTCCKVVGKWGCCPSPNAVCCSDEKHCCPSGYACNDAAGTCSKTGSGNFADVEKVKVIPNSPLNNILCPDRQSECPENNTCCMTTSGEWGCCPQSNAVCCPDKIHCCPTDYACRNGHCVDARITKTNMFVALTEIEKTKMIPKPSLKNGIVICPDGESQCPSDNTCCKTSRGFGCCPKVNAVCCSDEKHCCPEGSHCHSDGHCASNERNEIPWLEKVPGVRHQVKDNPL